MAAPLGVSLRDATREELAAARQRSSGEDGQATDAPLPARVKAMAKAETACRYVAKSAARGGTALVAASRGLTRCDACAVVADGDAGPGFAASPTWSAARFARLSISSRPRS